jgi:hypothetical protein
VKIMGKRKNWVTKKLLTELWINQNKTTKEVSKELGVDASYFFKKFKIEKPNHLIVENRKKTCKERYNEDNPAKVKKFQDKMRKTNLNKRGHEYPGQCPEVQKKMRKTNLDNTGYEYNFQDPKQWDKVKKTSQIKYNTDSPNQAPEVQNKQRQSIYDGYDVYDWNQRNITNYDEWINHEKFKEWVIRTSKAKKREVLGKDVSEYFNVSLSKGFEPLHRLDNDETMQKYYNIGKSIKEEMVADWLKKHNIIFEQRNRNIITPYELDFYIPERKIAIEVNDTLTHNITKITWSSQKPKDMYYHLMKTTLCKDKNIFLIHIFEKDLDKLELILNPLMPKQITGASKLKLKKNINCREFLNNNHRQGAGNTVKGYVLTNKTGDIMACMTFSKTRNRSKGDYELNRYCVKSGWNIKFAAERLFKNFLKDNPGKKIVSYCDRTYNICKVYERIGFEYSHNTEPNYKWVKNNEWLTREACQRHKLSQKFNKKEYETYVKDGGLTEKEIMIKEGYVQIYDCGNSVFYYTPENLT